MEPLVRNIGIVPCPDRGSSGGKGGRRAGFGLTSSWRSRTYRRSPMESDRQGRAGLRLEDGHRAGRRYERPRSRVSYCARRDPPRQYARAPPRR
jgi:hypothetical protein